MQAGRLATTLVILSLSATSPRAQDVNRDPVFFVHGHGLSSASWASMIGFLEGQGYPSQFLRAIDLVPRDGLNQPAAELQIAPAIEDFLHDVNAFLAAQGYTGPAKTRVDLVSHSMGGLSSRWYAAVVAPQRVDTWISLAGANHGTNDLCPYVGPVPTGADDCCPAYSSDPQDTVQLTLNGLPHVDDVDETPYGIGSDAAGVAHVPPDSERRIFYVTIRTEPDNWISPDDSVILDGTGGIPFSLPNGFPAVETAPGNFLMTNGVSHDPMTSNRSVEELVLALLNLEVGPYCGDGMVQSSQGEQCDDGNHVTGDCCNAACQFEPAGSPCDDGDACTENWCDAGLCISRDLADCPNLGDVDCNGRLDSADALVTLCLFVGLCEESTLPYPCSDPAYRRTVADWDLSGLVDSTDALATLAAYVALIPPCETALGACCCTPSP